VGHPVGAVVLEQIDVDVVAGGLHRREDAVWIPGDDLGDGGQEIAVADPTLADVVQRGAAIDVEGILLGAHHHVWIDHIAVLGHDRVANAGAVLSLGDNRKQILFSGRAAQQQGAVFGAHQRDLPGAGGGGGRGLIGGHPVGVRGVAVGQHRLPVHLLPVVGGVVVVYARVLHRAVQAGVEALLHLRLAPRQGLASGGLGLGLGGPALGGGAAAVDAGAAHAAALGLGEVSHLFGRHRGIHPVFGEGDRLAIGDRSRLGPAQGTAHPEVDRHRAQIEAKGGAQSVGLGEGAAPSRGSLLAGERAP